MPSSLAWPTRSRNGDWNVVTQAPIGIAVPIGVYEYRPRMSSLRGNTCQRAYHFAKANAHTLGCLREICDGLGACIMTTAWREFEKLIARIEQAMAPSGATVKSPDHIPDNVTGQLREVDASIRYKVGTCPILITIECRDRSSIEDVTWIEQLVEKKRSLGAAMTVAVTSSHFSAPAIKKAAASGIEIRALAEASPNEFVQWLRFQNVVLDLSEWSVADLAFDLYDGPKGPPPPNTTLSSGAQQSLRDKGHLAPILIRNSDGKRSHIENILIEWCKHKGTFFPSDLPTDGSKVGTNSAPATGTEPHAH
jgi:hypothetical protein